MKRLRVTILGALGGASCLGGSALGQVVTTSPGSGQASAVRAPSSQEVQLLQALRANPATAPYAFSTEPRGSKVVLRGRVGGRIVHDVAIRTAIALGVPVEDGIIIDTAFVPGGPAGVPNYGPVPGPGPTTTGGVGHGGPPAFGNYGPGGGFTGSGVGGYNAGFGGVSPLAGFPSAASYGGAPSILPPPIFGRYDDPFYGFDPPNVIYPPWWGALDAQRRASNAAFDQAIAAVNGVAANPVGPGPGAPLVQAAGSPVAATGPAAAAANGAVIQPNGAEGVPADMTATDVGLIPDGTIDMAIDGQGVATLRGAVPSMAERINLGQRVATMPGVTQVVNLLTIKPSLANRVVAANANPNPTATPPAADPNVPPPPPTPAGAPEVGANAAPNPNVNIPAARPAPIVSTPAIDPSSDAGLTDRASRALADRAALLTSPVRVRVSNGIATLTGKVPTVYEAMLAYRSVQQTPGIRGIDDRLEFVVPSDEGANPLRDRGRPDDVEPYLEAQIKRQVGDFAHIDRVRLQADVLEIRGTLARAEDRDRFDAILRSMPLLRGFQVRSDMPVSTP